MSPKYLIVKPQRAQALSALLNMRPYRVTLSQTRLKHNFT